MFVQVAQLQKQKKKASKKAGGGESQKETESPSAETPEGAATPAEEPAAEEKKDESPEDKEKPEERVNREPSPLEPMPEAPTSPGPEAEPQSAKLDTPRAAHGRQPSLSIQSKMRSSSFRKSSVSQGSVSPSPSTTLKSPSLPPLTGDGDAVHEVYRKQSTKIEELMADNKRLEKELEEATGRWKKTEDQLEDLREASVDVGEVKDKLQKAEEKAAGIDELVGSSIAVSQLATELTSYVESRDRVSPTPELTSANQVAPQQCQRVPTRCFRVAAF